MERAKNIAGRTKRRFMAVFCVVIASLAVIAIPVYKPLASHLNGTIFQGPPYDGALDLQSHRNGLYKALRENYVGGLMMMTEQFVTVMMEQAFVVATFFDAEQQLEVQRTLQELAAQAHKDFHSSWQMCQFGTAVKSLAQADRISTENTQILDSIMEKRQRENKFLASAGGVSVDYTNRIRFFKDTYCNKDEANKGADKLCDQKSAPIKRQEKDLDYPRLVDTPYTLDVNYTDDKPGTGGNPSKTQTDEEKDIIALGHNLYGHTVIDFMPEQLMNELTGQSLFMETRSIQAIRSVARRSFTHIVGMKAEGDMTSKNTYYQVRPFLYGVIKELGVPEKEISDFLGENPSYFAQMEVLTRKIYQSPEFFTNLYDKPANVKRIGVALQAIALMQDRDRYESALRREMLISLIVELKLRRYQEDMNSILYSAISKKPDRPE